MKVLVVHGLVDGRRHQAMDARRKAALVMEIIQGTLWVAGLLAVLPVLRAASISPAVVAPIV